MGIPETVTELLDPVVGTLGVELVDVEWSGTTLRVVVDAPDGVTSDQLAKINRLASPMLDQHDPIPGRYTLEVSSPGVERNLNRFDHYERAVGEDVLVKLRPGLEPRRIKGRLVEAVDGRLVIDAREIDGTDLAENQTHRVVADDVAKGRTVFNWGPKPKPGKKGSRNQPGQGGKQAKNRKHEKESS